MTNFLDNYKKIALLKEKKKAFDDAIDKEIELLQKEVDDFISKNIKENGVYEDEDVIISRSLDTKKKVVLLNVLSDENATERLKVALASGRVTGSVSIKFEKELLGLSNYASFFEVVPDEKVKVTLKEVN